MEFRLIDFHIYDETTSINSDDENLEKFIIQMFGKDEKGKTYSVFVENFKPFFYVKVGKRWTESVKRNFIREIKRKKGNDTIYAATLIKRNKLYGFDGGEKHQFIKKVHYLLTKQQFIKKIYYLLKNTNR